MVIANTPMRMLGAVLGIRSVLFPCVPLPAPPTENVVKCTTLTEPQTALWGLTFWVTNELLRIGRIDAAGGQLPLPPEGRRAYVLGDAGGSPVWWTRVGTSEKVIIGVALLGVLATVGWNWRSIGTLARA